MTSLAYSWSRRFSRSVSWRGFMSIRQSEPMGWPLGARSDAGVEAAAVFFEQRVVRKTPVAGEVFDDHHLFLRDAAHRVPRGHGAACRAAFRGRRERNESGCGEHLNNLVPPGAKSSWEGLGVDASPLEMSGMHVMGRRKKRCIRAE